jgi:mannose-6-phosphate isomerase-like protein (cupin superfamily)
MKPTIRHYHPLADFHIDEGCYINELSNSPDDPDLSIARARVPVGITTRWHRLEGVTERYCILQGEGRVEIGDIEPTSVSIGDVVIIPPGCRQRISNTGEGDLIFLAICTPRFDAAIYTDLEPPAETSP